MTTARVTVEVDGTLIERARDRSGRPGRQADEVVEDALLLYLGFRALDEAQAESELTEEEAERIAYEELHAMRRERDASD